MASTLRKIVFAFDVGTTQTGISYCILEPGEVPQKRSMHKYVISHYAFTLRHIHAEAHTNRFPGQEYTNGSHKIPTVMYYNSDGEVEAAGAETLSDEIIEKASEKGWSMVRW